MTASHHPHCGGDGVSRLNGAPVLGAFVILEFGPDRLDHAGLRSFCAASLLRRVVSQEVVVLDETFR